MNCQECVNVNNSIRNATYARSDGALTNERDHLSTRHHELGWIGMYLIHEADTASKRQGNSLRQAQVERKRWGWVCNSAASAVHALGTTKI